MFLTFDRSRVLVLSFLLLAACGGAAGADDGASSDSEVHAAPPKPARVAACPDGTAFALADFDGDGRTDVACHDANHATTYVAFSTGEGSFVTTKLLLDGFCGAGGDFGAADFDGDGKADLYCHEPDTALTSVALSTGRAPFRKAGVWLSAWCGASGFGAADFDGDGKADLYCHESDLAITSVALSTGTSFTARGVWLSSWCGGSDFGVGDFDVDGKADLYCHEPGLAITSVALSTGVSFTARGVWLSSWCGDGGDFGAADFDGDGRADLYCHEPDTSLTSVAFASTHASFVKGGVWSREPCGANGPRAAAGDVDGDGRADLACRATTADAVAIALATPNAFAQKAAWPLFAP